MAASESQYGQQRQCPLRFRRSTSCLLTSIRASTGEILLSTSAAAFRMVTGRVNAMKNKHLDPDGGTFRLRHGLQVGPVDGQYGSLLVSNSKVRVRDKDCDDKRNDERCRCEATLDEAARVPIRDGRPGPYLWSPGLGVVPVVQRKRVDVIVIAGDKPKAICKLSRTESVASWGSRLWQTSHNPSEPIFNLLVAAPKTRETSSGNEGEG